MQIQRGCFQKLLSEIKRPEISILLGPRQVGKSTLMRHLEAAAKKSGRSVSFYDLEQPSDLNRLKGAAEDILRELSGRNRVVFLDEFHYLKNASKIFKALYDSRAGVKIYASGSSSLEIHKHLKESLAGRFIRTQVFPLSLDEWRQVPGFADDRYLVWGGLPGLVHRKTADGRVELLNNILSTYITKDIKGIIKEENVRAFNTLLYLLAQSQGSIVAAASLARETGLSESTVARHLEIMSQTYVLHALPSYSANLANELKKSKKYYFFDAGIRNALLKDFRQPSVREDKGVVQETAVMLHLVSRLKPNMELRFWRTKKGEEVDFVLLKNRIPVPIEVKSSLSSPEIPPGVSSFLRRYAQAPFAVVFNSSVEESVKGPNRRVIHFKKWTRVSEWDYLRNVR